MIAELKAYTTIADIAKRLKVTPGRVHQLLEDYGISKVTLPSGGVLILRADVAKIPKKRPNGRPKAVK